MYFASVMRPESTADIWKTVLVVGGDLSTDKLECALKVLRRRHDALRTTFLERDGEVLQVVHGADGDDAAQPALISLVEAEGNSPGGRREWADAEAERLVDIPFDTSSGPVPAAQGTTVLRRPHSDFFRAIGFFADTVVLRGQVVPTLTFDQLLGLVRETVQDALDYRDVPFDVVVDALAPHREADRNPLFRAAIGYDTIDPSEVWALEGLQVAPAPELAGLSGLQFDLSLDVQRLAGEIAITVEYDRRRFSEAAMQRFAEAYGNLLRSLSRAPDVPLGSIPVLDQAVQAETLMLGAGGETQDGRVPAECTSAWELFELTATTVPEREAVSAGGEWLTLAELASRARTMAAGLRVRGVRTGTMVGICLPRRSDLIVAMLATWCAGARAASSQRSQ